jgi:hypothetical protein
LERLATRELLMALGPVNSSSYTDDALAVMREILAERGVDPDTAPPLVCPSCLQALDLEHGEVESKTGGLMFLLYGFGYQPTWFRSTTTGAQEVVIRPRTPRPAARCKHCGLVMFGGRL